MNSHPKGRRLTVPALVGCLSALCLAAIAATALVVFNWPRIRSLAESAAGMYQGVRAVQRALQTRYHTPQVNVRSGRRSDLGSLLTVELVNPPFLAEINDGALESKAREVAIVAREALPLPSGYDAYQVILTRQMGVGFAISRRHVSLFRASELPPPKPHP